MPTLLLAAVAVSSLGCVTVLGSGVVRSDRHDVPAFRRIELNGGRIVATIQHGPAPRVEVTGDDNLLSLLRVEVENGKLIIEPRDQQSFRPRTPLVVNIWTTGAEALDVSGGVKVDVQGGLLRRARVEASGGVELAVAPVDFESLELEFSGGVEARIAGRAQRLDLDASGGVQLDASRLLAQAVEVDLSGGCDVQLSAAQSLEGDVSGGVSLRVHGDPLRSRVQSSGGATVRFAQ